MKFKSILSCLLILVSIVATFSPITEVFCEKNSLLRNFEDVSSSIAKVLEDPVSSSSPDPDVYEIDYPSSITLGESVYITIRGKNRGDDANEGDLSISFPGNPSDVEIVDTDASNSHIAWPGDLIWVGYGDHQELADYPLAEVWEAPWRAGSARYLTVRVTLEAAGTFSFYVKMVAEAGGVWFADPTTDGSESSRRDQQNEYVRRYSIDVGSPKPDPDVYDVDYPSSITLGESVYITIRGKNRGDEADEGYLSMSFPDNPDDVEIVDTNAAHSDVSWPSEWIWAGYGQYQVRADYPLAEVWEAPWPTDTRRRLEVRVTPEIAGTFTFYVKMVAQAGGVWYGDPKTDGSESSRRDQQDEYVRRYTIDVQELPEPSLNVWVDSYPSSITLGESAYIKIYGENLGDQVGEGDLQISFPDNPSDVEIVSTDASHGTIAWPGDWIWAGYGQYQVVAEYPHAEVWEAPWPSGVRRYLEVRVTPESVGTFTFYVKMVAEAGGVWFADPETDGSESPIMDEQDEYVYGHTIEVVETSNVDAEIVDFDVEEGTFHPGDVVQAEAVISNTGDCTHTFRIDYAIRDGGGHYWGVYNDDREIAEGASLTLNDELDWTVPPGVAEGDCDGRILVLDPDTSETYDSQWDREGPTIFKEPAEPPDLTVSDPEFDGRTVCLNGVVFGATRLHWDWDDGYEEDHWFAACHTYETYGTYTITVTAYSDEGLTSTETKTVHTLTIESSIGGYTDPSAGSYFYNEGDEVFVTVYPDEDYTLDHWILDGHNAASGNPIQVVMDSGHTLEPGFKLTQLPDFGTYEGWPDPWSPKAGDEVTFWAEVFLDADEPYTVWIDWHLDGSPFEAKRVTLSQGQNIVSTDESWTAKVGEHTIRWVIDESNEFQETDETNNEEEIEFSVEEVDKRNLIFNVIFEGHCYTVSLWVPSLTYTNLVQQIGSIIYTWYPNVQKSILEQAYYVWYHVESPNSFPILNVCIEENGQPISEKALRIQVVDALLKYCFQLFNAAWPDKLAEYHSFGEQWLDAYEDSAWTVQVSDALSNVHFLTIIGPIIGSIKHLYGATTSVQVKETVSLVYKILRGTPELVKSFGTQKTNTIVNTLISFGLISSSDYNGMELYRKLESDPSIAMDFIEDIDSDILGFNLNSDASSIVYNSLTKIPTKSIGAFVPGVALGLYAYFGSGLTASTASQILSDAFFTGILKYAIPLAIADAIAEGYIVPMASAIHAAWEDMGYMAESYFDMYEFGLGLTEPNDNTLDLTKAKIFASLYGALCIQEYDYYMNTYFYRSRQLFVPQSELDGYKSSAELILSQAEEWANVLDSIYDYAEAIVLSTDPEGSTFDFPLQPPHDNVLPAVQENASGVVLVTGSTLDITMKCETFLFTVQDGMWFSNFTYSVFFDDPNGTSYAVIFNPPEQNYAVNTQNETLMALRNFESLNGNVIVSDVGEVTGTDLYFYVSDSSAEASSVIPEFPLLFILPLFMIATLLAAILYRRRQWT